MNATAKIVNTPAQALDVKPSPGGKKPKQRSPAYPFIDLPKALGTVKTIWEKENRHDARPEALATHFGIEPKSSALALTLSALIKYGLLDEVGSGGSRTLKLSAFALKTLREDQSEEEVAKLKKEAALKPEIFKYLWLKYGPNLPSDASLKTHLVMDRNFTDAAAKTVIRHYKSTIAFAKLTDSDTEADRGLTPSPETAEQQPEDEMEQQVVDKPIQRNSPPADAQGRQQGDAPTVVYREFTIPLPSGAVGTFKLPFPSALEDFDAMQNALTGFKDGLVKKSPPVVISGEGWEKKALTLAEHGFEFDLHGFNFTFDIGEASEIAKSHGLQLRFDPIKEIAFFRKK